ncbi:MAG: hypothetical protein ACK528_08180 [Alphaproteobacteria bacterium]
MPAGEQRAAIGVFGEACVHGRQHGRERGHKRAEQGRRCRLGPAPLARFFRFALNADRHRLVAEADAAFAADENVFGIDQERAGYAVVHAETGDAAAKVRAALVIRDQGAETARDIDAGELGEGFAHLAALADEHDVAVRRGRGQAYRCADAALSARGQRAGDGPLAAECDDGSDARIGEAHVHVDARRFLARIDADGAAEATAAEFELERIEAQQAFID